MSSQRGNVARKRPQKHQNSYVFKNDLHDTNIRTKRINQVQIVNVCEKCKSILQWKIKYKKYKMLKAAKSCNKCLQKSVKEPYHTICNNCAFSNHLCPKCGTIKSKVDDETSVANISDACNENIDSDLADKLDLLLCHDDDNCSSNDSDDSCSYVDDNDFNGCIKTT